MRKLQSYKTPAGLLAVLLLTALAASPLSAEILWLKSYGEARAEAKRLNRPLVVHFYADWCAPCRQMEREVLSSAVLSRQLGEKIVAVKINTDRHPGLTEAFNIQVLPSDVVVSPQGRILARFSGYQSRNRYISRIAQVEHRWISSQTESGNVVAEHEVERPLDGNPFVNDSHSQAASAAEPAMLGMKGFSPVQLYDHRAWKKGSERYAAEYKGVLYRMTDAGELARFRADPAKYAPRLLGCDPVVLSTTDRAVPGSVQFGAYYDNELYLFVSHESRSRFRDNPSRYTRLRHVLRVDQIERTAMKD